MALHFNFSKVADYQTVTTDPSDPDKWHPVADALVWLSMICGYNSITLKNVDKVITRIMAYQAVAGAFLRHKGAPIYLTAEDVRRFIGMTTNASTKTDAQWQRHLGNIATDHGKTLHRKLENAQTPSALSYIASIN